MKAWPLLFLIACHPDSNCGIEGETPDALAVFQIQAPQPLAVLEWVPALPHWGPFSELVLFEEAWTQQPADSTQVTLNLDTPPSLLAEDHNARALFFVPALFQDNNLDGLHSPDEPYLSVSTQVIGYFESVGCEEWSELAHPGWNGIDLSGPQPTSWNLEDFSLGEDLRSMDTLTVAVQLDAGDGLRVALAPERIWLDDFMVSSLLDQTATTTMTLEMPFSPPENHLQTSDVAGDRFLDWQYAVELPLLYTDTNNSGNLDWDDSLEQALCAWTDETALAARIGHYPEPDTAEEALYMKTNPVQAGWGLYVETVANGWAAVDPEAFTLAPGDCPLPNDE
jgi:hypothetical protein